MNTKNTIDSFIATGGMTAPWWIDSLSWGLGLFTLAGGAILMCIRLALAIREWREGKKNGN